MHFIDLERRTVVVRSRRECGPDCRPARTDLVPYKVAVHPVFAEIFVDARIPLIRVVVARRVEDTVVKYRRGTRNVVGTRSVASGIGTKILWPKRIQSSGRNSSGSCPGGFVFRH